MPEPRRCGCGCGASLDGRSPRCQYVNDAHRAEAFRKRHGILPVSQQQRAHARAGARARSGLQVSYRKAVGAVALAYRIEGVPEPEASIAADLVLRGALSPRQQRRLEEREARLAA